MRRIPPLSFGLVLLIGLAACGGQRGLYVAHDTAVGVHGAVNTEKQSGHLMIGYDRDFATIIPRSVPVDEGSEDRDVMSLFGCNAVETEGIFLVRYTENIATGDAAADLASLFRQEPDASSGAADGEENEVRNVFNCFEDLDDAEENQPAE
ncbi:MAG: hypothetical protein GVY09_08300 [Gammaproteobacteria bacterium]|jgi:hypothetical protein|nr:hypothetical protein [Gammaproteobacteria bacterium]